MVMVAESAACDGATGPSAALGTALAGTNPPETPVARTNRDATVRRRQGSGDTPASFTRLRGPVGRFGRRDHIRGVTRGNPCAWSSPTERLPRLCRVTRPPGRDHMDSTRRTKVRIAVA